MAAMNYQTARALAERLIQSGQGGGQPREAIINQLMQTSRAQGGTPEGAIASVFAPQPREVTPATPAPMQPGIELVAPKPTAPAPVQIQEDALSLPEAAPQPAARPSRFRQMLDNALADIGASEGVMSQAAANKQPVDIMEQARLRGLRGRAQQLQDYVQGEESASLPEEMQTAFNRQQERLTRREELLQEARSRAPFEALLAGGAAMAAGRRGERFTEALARGLQAGASNFGQGRAEREEGTESVGEARDQIVMNRYNALEKARTNAVALVSTGQEIDERTLRMSKMTSEDALNLALAPFAVRKGEAQARSAEIDAENAPAEFASQQNVRAAQVQNYREQPGSNRVDVEGRGDRNELDKAARNYEGKRAAYNAALRESGMKASMIPSDVKNDFLSAEAELKSVSAAYERRYGKTPYIGGSGGRQQNAPKGNAIPTDPLGIRPRS